MHASADSTRSAQAVRAAGLSAKLPFPSGCADNRLGPNLYRIIGRLAGSVDDYGYSSAMDNADFVWDEATLDRFIANPEQVVPGNNMKPFGGISSKEDRAKIIGFLRAQGGG
jgi:cytochrome c2